MERLTHYFNKKNVCNASAEVCEQQKSNPNDDVCCCYCDIQQKMIDKLAEYEDAEEQGLLLRLPCKVGDTIYVIDHERIYSLVTQNNIYFAFGKIHILCESSCFSDIVCYDDLNKTVFLTKAEAEQALQQMQEGKEWKS